MNRMKQNAIKESFDNLPSGVCFFDGNGIAILCNHQMRRLGFYLTGMDLQSLSDVQRIMEGEVQNARLDKGIFLLENGSAWRFSSTPLTSARGNIYTQVIAADVTELHKKMNELEENNRRLEEIGARMRRYSANIIAITREEELLRMKMRVHDDMGRSIIATRRLLKQGVPSNQFNLAVWQNAIQMLKHSNDVPESDSLSLLVDAARSIGIRICLEGELPEDAEASALIIAAMRECATNAVRHANATELYVKCIGENGFSKAVITSSGARPQEETAEGGGLTSLRARIERSGGSMLVSCLPEYALTVAIPIKKGDAL